MPIPEEVQSKVGSLPDLTEMDKDSLVSLVKELYDRSCQIFSEQFDVQHIVQVRLKFKIVNYCSANLYSLFLEAQI